MNTHILERHFAKIGARVRVHPLVRRTPVGPVAIDIGHDREGEFFDVAVRPEARPELSILDARPELRHLLLMTREDESKHKFLCGHDERHWFVAAEPVGVRAWQDSPCRPQDDHAGRLAPRADEHRDRIGGDAACGVHRLSSPAARRKRVAGFLPGECEGRHGSLRNCRTGFDSSAGRCNGTAHVRSLRDVWRFGTNIEH